MGHVASLAGGELSMGKFCTGIGREELDTIKATIRFIAGALLLQEPSTIITNDDFEPSIIRHNLTAVAPLAG